MATSVRNLTEVFLFQLVTWAHIAFAGKNWENPHWIYKRLKGTILDGDLYRLVSPYETNHSSVMYVDKAKSKSVLFAYDIHPRFGEKTFPVKLQGLDPNKKYKVQEINLMPGQKSTLVTDGGTFSGDFLMKIGMNVFSTAHARSKVIELTEVH